MTDRSHADDDASRASPPGGAARSRRLEHAISAIRKDVEALKVAAAEKTERPAAPPRAGVLNRFAAAAAIMAVLGVVLSLYLVSAARETATGAQEAAANVGRTLKAWKDGFHLRPAVNAFRDCAVCPEMVVVPAGNANIRPAGYSGLLNPNGTPMPAFAIGVYEVTAEEWEAYRSARAGEKPLSGHTGPAAQEGNIESFPVVGVSPSQVEEYVEWLSGKTQETYRLPTWTEWEYAARAGVDTALPPGYDVYRREHGGAGGVGKVGASFPRNGFGLFDVAGNASELTQVPNCGTPYGFLATYFQRNGGGGRGGWQGNWLQQCKSYAKRGGDWMKPSLDAFDWLFESAPGDDNTGFRVARDLRPGAPATAGAPS